MKKYYSILFLLALLLTFAIPTFAQDRNNEDEVVRLDPMTAYNAKPGQVIVKFHDRSDIRVSPQNAARFVSQSRSISINSILAEYEVVGIEQLLPEFQMPAQTRSAKSYGGQDVVEHDLSQLHLITISPNSSKNEYELIEALKELDEVEFAEPNYICYALGTPVSEPITEVLRDDLRRGNSAKNPPFTTNDPMYPMQWGIPACHIDSLLTAPKIHGNWRPIIAFLDTGVDIDHPDLAANIWTNSAEANGATGADDDGNNLVDDIHGWDFVNQTGEMHDFNSHGTHCAGIAAAVGNNGIGITGACPDALIMPVTVMQSDGTGDIATIIKGVNYAAQNGADIISMSIGTYAYSIAFEQALGQAYQNAVLVAAAGNDGRGMKYCCATCLDMFPAAFTFVFGVQATIPLGGLAGFSNYDCTGPFYSVHSEEELYNYELSAPGANIISTVPNGQYRSYNGSSMACPLVAGGIASLLQRRDYQTNETLFGDLINYSHEFQPVDFWAAYSADSAAPAILQMVAFEVNDTLYGDGSMYADAGERVQIYPTIRTVWGSTDSLEMWLEFQEFEDTNTVHILQNHVQLGHPLSAYAKAKSANPIDVLVDSNVVDGRHISLVLCATASNAQDTLRQDFVMSVTNGVKLHGMLTHNDTLWPNVQYIVTDNFAIPSGVTLVIMPGTTIKIGDNQSVSCAGSIKANGSTDSLITFTKTDLGNGWNNMILNQSDTFKYVVIEYFNISFISMSYPYFENCIFRNGRIGYLQKKIQTYKTNFFQNTITNVDGQTHYFCNFDRNNIINNVSHNNLIYNLAFLNYGSSIPIKSSNIFSNGSYSAVAWDNTPVVYVNNSIYWGTSNPSTVKQREVYDFDTPGSGVFGYLDLSNMRTKPDSLAHGIVWKVEVNGYDAQDQFDSIVPLGVGTHEFKVYFNRAMDTAVTPMLAMGVRPPYTQTAIGESAYWSADSTIWTAHVTLTGRSAIDGLNRIYVANAQDNEHFEIPYENQRFNVLVASSGSMSAGFMATAGIGKVDLEWNDQEVNYDDFLGFNMYRYQYDSITIPAHYDENWNWIEENTYWGPTDTIRLNTTLIQDTTFTDFNVVPGKRYYYFYKILSTALTENSPSKTVSCVPNSSILGDANGSYHVDIADVITTINYVTGQNPQPFLFGAADVNGDGDINVLDIVGIINIILHPDQYNSKDGEEPQTAVYTVEDGILYVNTPVALGGLQFRIADCTYADIELLEALNGFEIVHMPNSDGSLTILAYSMSGMTVPEGRTALLRIGNKTIDDIVLSDPEGHNVIAINGNINGVTDIETLPAQIQKAYPNPFQNEVNIEFVIGKDNCRKVQLVFTDMLGRTVDVATLGVSNAGKYRYTWNAGGRKGGVYFATLYVDGVKAHTVKLIMR
ncbi:MAG: S8 family serine peptidase [Bacteroidales bacterium]|nr:S8 family serine peptidase [Bacteroidales bacterium]